MPTLTACQWCARSVLHDYVLHIILVIRPRSPCGGDLDIPIQLSNHKMWKQNSEYVECDIVVRLIHQSRLDISHSIGIGYRLQHRLSAT